MSMTLYFPEWRARLGHVPRAHPAGDLRVQPRQDSAQRLHGDERLDRHVCLIGTLNDFRLSGHVSSSAR
jgi:hypothetical protein